LNEKSNYKNWELKLKLEMKLKPEELEDHGYALMDTLGHMDIIPFVKKHIKTKTFYSVVYKLINIIAAFLLGFWLWKCHEYDGVSIGKGLNYLSYGIFIALALIPLHEFIHVLAYKSQGATKTSYDANFKKFYFMAIADQFVANKKEFIIVALAPFSVISSVLLVMLIFSGPLFSITLLSTLLAHTACCSGDFGMLSYFEVHKDKMVVTYDDKSNGISYFYGKS